jgi:hypothetical protein
MSERTLHVKQRKIKIALAIGEDGSRCASGGGDPQQEMEFCVAVGDGGAIACDWIELDLNGLLPAKTKTIHDASVSAVGKT